MSSSTIKPPRRKVGRPRAAKPSTDLPAEQVILAAARDLFRAHGYAATSTRQIADAAGLRQPSLFHYFASKTAILQAIVDLAVKPELEFIANEAKRGLAADVALYRYARFVFRNLATNPNVIGSPLQFPEAKSMEFAGFWKSYEVIFHALVGHIRSGVRAGLFDPVNVTTAAEQIFALLEAPLSRPRRSDRRGSAAAEQAADLVLKGLLKAPERLPEVREAAARQSEG